MTSQTDEKSQVHHTRRRLGPVRVITHVLCRRGTILFAPLQSESLCRLQKPRIPLTNSGKHNENISCTNHGSSIGSVLAACIQNAKASRAQLFSDPPESACLCLKTQIHVFVCGNICANVCARLSRRNSCWRSSASHVHRNSGVSVLGYIVNSEAEPRNRQPFSIDYADYRPVNGC